VLEELAHWDELSDERLGRLERLPSNHSRLQRLRQLDAWLTTRARVASPCPPSEQLYHFGRGPGYEPLAAERRDQINEHLAECSTCAGLVESLRASPPLPLDVSPPLDAPLREAVSGPFGLEAAQASRSEGATSPRSAPEPARSRRDDPFVTDDLELEFGGGRGASDSRAPDAGHGSPIRLGAHWPEARGKRSSPRSGADRPGGPRTLPAPFDSIRDSALSSARADSAAAHERAPRSGSPRRLRPLLPLAAAASLMWILVLISEDRELTPVHSRPDVFPALPTLRGESGGPLFFPRGAVLAPSTSAGGSMATLSRDVWADAPQFEIEAVEGASLYRVILRRHDGTAFAEGRDIEHIESQRTPLKGARSLAPGHYTWEAWAIVDGLDRRLGARDFEVLASADLLGELQGLDDRAAVIRLHEAGFLTDARALAERMPASPERDAYLQALPGR
jgi:hypothetical protein